jgi:hypothetical protein
MVFTNSVLTSWEIQCVPIKESRWLMLCREIIVANSENHGKKHNKYALWERSRIYLITNEAGVTYSEG